MRILEPGNCLADLQLEFLDRTTRHTQPKGQWPMDLEPRPLLVSHFASRWKALARIVVCRLRCFANIPTNGATRMSKVLFHEHHIFNKPKFLFSDKKMQHPASRLMAAESAVSQQHSSMAGYGSRGHEEAPYSKYEMAHSSGNSRTLHGGHSYPSEDVSSVSKMSSYSSAPGGMPGPQHSSRDQHASSMSAYERDPYAREHEQNLRTEARGTVSAIEKYFSSEEIKQFSEYNRFLVMSSPGQQKKFYESLTTAEFNRFRDYVDFDRNNKPTSSFKAALPPPIPQSSVPPIPVPTPYESHTSAAAYPPSYSFASSFYEEDKMSTGSGGIGHRPPPPLHHMKASKYSASSGSPPPSMAPFMKGMAAGYPQAYPEHSSSSYETRPLPPIRGDLSAGMARYAEMSSRKELTHESMRDALPSERSTLEYVRSSRSGGYRRGSRSRSRSSTPESRSRSSR